LASDMKNIADKTKDVKDLTGMFKNKFGGKTDVKDVLGVVTKGALTVSRKMHNLFTINYLSLRVHNIMINYVYSLSTTFIDTTP
jgi:hypothetical protein